MDEHPGLNGRCPNWGPKLLHSAPLDESTLFKDERAFWKPLDEGVSFSSVDGNTLAGHGGSGSGEEALQLVRACRRMQERHQLAVGEKLDRLEAFLGGHPGGSLAPDGCSTWASFSSGHAGAEGPRPDQGGGGDAAEDPEDPHSSEDEVDPTRSVATLWRTPTRMMSKGSIPTLRYTPSRLGKAQEVGPSKASGIWGTVQHATWRLVHRHEFAFDLIMAAVIVANCVCVGLEMQWDLEGKDISIFGHMEHFFLVAFVLELALRTTAHGLGAWKNPWFRFDAFLVVIGIASSWVVEPIVRLRMNSDPNGMAALDAFSDVLVMRILRILRLARALRMFEQFQEMWKLANGLMHSIRTVLSACTLLLGTIYVFACVGIEVITKNRHLQEDPETNNLIQTYFSSLHVTMITLFQFTHSDATASVYAPLVKRSGYLAFYFGALWLIVTVCLMNLVTAAIVDKAIAQGGVDREMQKAALRKKMIRFKPLIRSVFKDLDKSGDGELQLNEIADGLSQVDPRKVLELPDEILKILGGGHLIDLFEFLDTDDSGTVDEQEFLHGISHLLLTESLHAVPMETTQSLHIMRAHSKMLEVIKDLCVQGDRLRLASDHDRGAVRMSVYARPRLEIGRGTGAEWAPAKRNCFDIHLDRPLARDHAVHSHVAVKG